MSGCLVILLFNKKVVPYFSENMYNVKTGDDFAVDGTRYEDEECFEEVLTIGPLPKPLALDVDQLKVGYVSFPRAFRLYSTPGP